tara:strand:+ start:156989 stop:157522 length:534 start_codon:yes stop_codon:yes gene_type:complete
MDFIDRLKPKTGHLKYAKILITVVVIVGSVYFLFQALDRLQRTVEKQKVDATANLLRHQLRLKVNNLIEQHRKNDAKYFVGVNPMNWLEQKPKNYAGELFGPEAGKVAPGQWYFDLRDRNLTYLIRNCKDKTLERSQITFSFRLKWAAENQKINDDRVMRRRLQDILLEQTSPYVCA